MNLDAEARGIGLSSVRTPLTRSGLRAVEAQVRRRPSELYWRFRLVTGIDPSRPPENLRALSLESARRLVAADPGWFVSGGLPSMLVRRWTLAEAQALLDAFQCRPLSKERWTRARFWFSAAHRSVDPSAFLAGARRELEAIPVARRPSEHAEFLGEVLLRQDPPAFAREAEQLASKLPMSSPVVGSRLVGWMGHLEKLHADSAYEGLSKLFRALPIQLRPARCRVEFHNLEGLWALRRGDLASVRRSLEEMIELAPQADYLGNDDTMKLVRTLARRRLLRRPVRKYLDGVLQSDWREWVRPGVERLRRSL